MTQVVDKNRVPGRAAVAALGWWSAHRWLILRRLTQALFLALFLIGPLAGIWVVKGTLASSLTLDVLPLTDPLMALQSLIAGNVLEVSGLVGAATLFLFYALIGGRVYCSWFCPINPISDLASWLRARLGWRRSGVHLPRQLRLMVLAGALVAAAVTGTLAWEYLNPISIVQRALVFGTFFTGGIAWMVLLGVFLLELVGGNRPWCSHLCPVGAFYGLVGKKSVLRVVATHRERCDDCRDCYQVCPEAHVINPALKPHSPTDTAVIQHADCTNCGRCIDVCPETVFQFASRFTRSGTGPSTGSAEKPDRKAA
ncbi:MAG: quinol dehydrogenase ferredoxin subunit NapH [Magnetospiraceae bacterium]